MEKVARLFSSAKGARVDPGLKEQLTRVQPLYLAESLYASYVKREPSEYTHNSTRASIAITPSYRLVVVAAGHKQIDIPLGDPEWRDGVRIWTEKQGRRIHFKTDLQYYGTGMGGESLKIRVETENADHVMRIIDQATNPDTVNHGRFPGTGSGEKAFGGQTSVGPPHYLHEAPSPSPTELAAGQRYMAQELPANAGRAELSATRRTIRRKPVQ